MHTGCSFISGPNVPSGRNALRPQTIRYSLKLARFNVKRRGTRLSKLLKNRKSHFTEQYQIIFPSRPNGKYSEKWKTLRARPRAHIAFLEESVDQIVTLGIRRFCGFQHSSSRTFNIILCDARPIHSRIPHVVRQATTDRGVHVRKVPEEFWCAFFFLLSYLRVYGI